jgi:hypothetical protein
MGDERGSIGSPITLGEREPLGEFVRWQDRDARVGDIAAAGRLPDGYPLVPSRLPATGLVDLWLLRHWEQVPFVRLEGRRLGGDRRTSIGPRAGKRRGQRLALVHGSRGLDSVDGRGCAWRPDVLSA